MHRRPLLFLLALLVTFAGSGCGLLRRKKKPQPKGEEIARVVIGRVEMVNPEAKFALIHTFFRTALPAGAVLVSANDLGDTAQMKLSPEHKGIFLTADITSGEPAKGEPVFWDRAASPAAPSAPGAPPLPETFPVQEPSARISVPSAAAPVPELPTTPLEPPSASISPPPP